LIGSGSEVGDGEALRAVRERLSNRQAFAKIGGSYLPLLRLAGGRRRASRGFVTCSAERFR